MKADKEQKQQIYALVGFDKGVKEELVQWVTGDNSKTSTNDLTFEQANRIISKLGGKTMRRDSWGRFNINKQSHKQILSLLRTLRWVKPDPKHGEVADLERFSEWLKSKKSPVNKPLAKMETNEVSKVIVALEGMI